jgi:N-acetylglucosaminyldiphosphoundecaprenol N-acetyl-beta-D-mannosaminyltransferase
MQSPSTSETPRVDAPREKRRVRIGEIEMDPLTLAAAIDAIEGLVRAGRGGTVFTPNVDHFVLAAEDERFRAAYRDTDLSLVDGTPVLWAARALGSPLPEKVSGSDLLLPVIERGARYGWRVFLLGAAPGIAERVKAIVEAEYPGVRVVGTSSPNIDLARPISDQKEIIDAVKATKPDVLFLALGSPKQEIWAHRIRETMKPTVVVGVGATFDFVAGTAKRAPRWISRAGLEWLYRLAHEPRRLWKRYLVRDPKFAVIVLRESRSSASDRRKNPR